MRTVRASPGVSENSKNIAGRGGYMGTVRTSPGVYENSKSITLGYMRTVIASPRGI